MYTQTPPPHTHLYKVIWFICIRVCYPRESATTHPLTIVYDNTLTIYMYMYVYSDPPHTHLYKVYGLYV